MGSEKQPNRGSCLDWINYTRNLTNPHPIPSPTRSAMASSSSSNPSAPPVPDSYGSGSQYNSNPDPYSYHPGNRPAQYNTPPQQQGSYQGGYAPSSSSSSNYGYGYGSGQQQPGIDPELIRAFQIVDRDRSGFIDVAELQQALSSGYQRFSLQTIRLLMFLFRNPLDNSSLRLGFNEFVAVWNCLGLWRSIFERYDQDRSGKMDATELRGALLSVGFAVPPSVLHLLLSHCGSRSGNKLELEFDNFVEVGMVVKGLTEKFKEKDTRRTGSASLQYETFMSMVLPFMVTYD
ncbi:hypothetical protein V2J09_000019 [Rumex salicifolius]